MFLGLGPKGIPKVVQGGPKGSSEGSKGVPSEPKVSPGGSHRGPKGVPKGSRGDQKTAKIEEKWGPCGNHAKNRLQQGKPWENHRKIMRKPQEKYRKTVGKAKENCGKNHRKKHRKTIGKP